MAGLRPIYLWAAWLDHTRVDIAPLPLHSLMTMADIENGVKTTLLAVSKLADSGWPMNHDA